MSMKTGTTSDGAGELRYVIAERNAAIAEAAACVKFINSELCWMGFRDEILQDSTSGKNLQKLEAFLADKGNHGAKFLTELNDAHAQIELLDSQLLNTQRDLKAGVNQGLKMLADYREAASERDSLRERVAQLEAATKS